MTKRFLSPISLANLSTDPTGSTGAFYYNTASNALKYYNGSTWVTLGAVTSFSAGTTGLTPSTGTTGAITLAGTLLVANGGTGTATAGITAFNNITGYTATGATGTTSTNLVFSTSPTLTTPTITGGTHTGITSLGIRDTSAAFDLTVGATSSVTLTAGRTLTLDVQNAARTISLAGNISLANNLTTTGNFALTLTTTAATTATLPSGTVTLQDLGSAQSITGVKTFSTAPVISTITNTGTITLPTATGTLALTSGVINNTLTTTTGDMIYASGANTPARLGIGSTGQVLTVSGGIPTWATATSIPYTPSALISSNITLVAFNSYFINTTAARTLTLPAAATLGDEIHIFDVTGTAATNNITVANNGLNIRGSAQTLVINVNYAAVVLVYLGATYGWRVS